MGERAVGENGVAAFISRWISMCRMERGGVGGGVMDLGTEGGHFYMMGERKRQRRGRASALVRVFPGLAKQRKPLIRDLKILKKQLKSPFGVFLG